MFLHRARLPIDKEYFVSLITGSETGVATTTGIIVALTSGDKSRSLILAAAGLSIFVQAFTGAVNRYSVIRTSREIDNENDNQEKQPILGALSQFWGHLVAGSIPLLSLLFVPSEYIIFASVYLAFLVLFAVGVIRGRFIRKHALRHTIQILFIGGIVIIVGLLVGYALRNY